MRRQATGEGGVGDGGRYGLQCPQILTGDGMQRRNKKETKDEPPVLDPLPNGTRERCPLQKQAKEASYSGKEGQFGFVPLRVSPAPSHSFMKLQ